MEQKKLVFYDARGNEIHLYDCGSFNKGSAVANKILSQSIRYLGCGKSILIDADNNIVAGTKIASAVHDAGIRKVRIIETEGDELIVVKRTDVALCSKKGLELSLVDNLSQDKNLIWDADAICDSMQAVLSFNPREWGGHSCLVKELKIEDLLKDDVEKKRNTSKEKDIALFDVQQYSLF